MLVQCVVMLSGDTEGGHLELAVSGKWTGVPLARGDVLLFVGSLWHKVNNAVRTCDRLTVNYFFHK